MVKRELIEDVLVELGLSPAMKGFRYICDIVELILEVDMSDQKAVAIYDDIAKRNNDNWKNVERAIRYSLTLIKNKNSEEKVKAFFGRCDGNVNAFNVFAYRMKRVSEGNGLYYKVESISIEEALWSDESK